MENSSSFRLVPEQQAPRALALLNSPPNPSISRREKKDDINHFVIDPHESAGAGRGLIE